MATASSFTSLPDDVLQRVLIGVALDDHDAATATCRAFRDVIRGPRFPALRRGYGFAERGIILVGSTETYGYEWGTGPVGIHVAGKHGANRHGAVAIIPSSQRDYLSVDLRGSTTDGGARLFLSMKHPGPNPAAPPEFAAHTVFAVDGTTRRWSRFATLPLHQRSHCLEWHSGLLYVAGGSGLVENKTRCLNTLHSFNETTGLWEDLPPMPHACGLAASGVIGNELFVAGGRVWFSVNGMGHYEDLSTLQIYDFTTRTWRLGPPLPRRRCGACGIVVDGKLYLVSSKLSDIYYDGQSSTMVYDVQSNTWTTLPDPPLGRFCADTLHAFAHNGRIVAFNQSGSAFQLGTHGDWSRFDLDVHYFENAVAGSVLLG